MEFFVLLFVWLIFGLIGYAIRPRWGFLLGFLLGPIGWVIAAMMRIGDPPKVIANSTNVHIQMAHVTPQPAPGYGGHIPPPPGRNMRLRIARDGVELGEWPEYEVAQFLQDGRLQGADYYYDHQAGQWLELVAHPRLS